MHIKYIMCPNSTRTIRVSIDTYTALQKLGTLSDSFNSVIQRLLDFQEKQGSTRTRNEISN
jgi:predicted CopG family antitoxin